jgi:hypothetical protein
MKHMEKQTQPPYKEFYYMHFVLTTRNRSAFFFNYLLKITIYSIVPITNLTKMSTWTKSYKEGKLKIILVKNTKKKHYA